MSAQSSRKPGEHFVFVAAKMTRHEQNVSSRGEMREQAAFLDHVTNAAAKLSMLSGVERRSIEFDFAAVRFEADR